MRSIKPWISTCVDSDYSGVSYDRLPAWLWHPYGCFDGILDGSVSDEMDLRNLLFILCAGAKVVPVVSPRYTLRLLLASWEKRFPEYTGGFQAKTGRSRICTGCCYNLSDMIHDLERIEQIPIKPDYREYGPNAWSKLWLGHDPDTTVIYENGYLNFYYYDPRRRKGHKKNRAEVSFTPSEWHARSWTCLWDLYHFTYGPFREYFRKLCPECADRLVKL